ncbi:unnamed protein product, partial [marine sediment metagenome]
AIGHARRMQVATPAMQHAVMIEAVENHMPEVIIIDKQSPIDYLEPPAVMLSSFVPLGTAIKVKVVLLSQ